MSDPRRELDDRTAIGCAVTLAVGLAVRALLLWLQVGEDHRLPSVIGLVMGFIAGGIAQAWMKRRQEAEAVTERREP